MYQVYKKGSFIQDFYRFWSFFEENIERIKLIWLRSTSREASLFKIEVLLDACAWLMQKRLVLFVTLVVSCRGGAGNKSCKCASQSQAPKPIARAGGNTKLDQMGCATTIKCYKEQLPHIFWSALNHEQNAGTLKKYYDWNMMDKYCQLNSDNYFLSIGSWPNLHNGCFFFWIKKTNTV